MKTLGLGVGFSPIGPNQAIVETVHRRSWNFPLQNLRIDCLMIYISLLTEINLVKTFGLGVGCSAIGPNWASINSSSKFFEFLHAKF